MIDSTVVIDPAPEGSRCKVCGTSISLHIYHIPTPGTGMSSVSFVLCADCWLKSPMKMIPGMDVEEARAKARMRVLLSEDLMAEAEARAEARMRVLFSEPTFFGHCPDHDVPFCKYCGVCPVAGGPAAVNSDLYKQDQDGAWHVAQCQHPEKEWERIS